MRALSLAVPLAVAPLLAFAVAAHTAAAPAAPAIKTRLLEGGTFDSRSLLGKKVLLVRFQASWCKVCAQELPDVERIHQAYAPRGVQILAVHVQDTETDARNFLAAAGATYPAALDPKLSIANRFGFKGTPYTVVVDDKGEMVARIHGSASELRMRAALDPVLDRPAAKKKPPPKRLQ